jgi:ATP-dependent RNA helicase SUPV3L1/SUV3
MLERLADMLRSENSRSGFEAKADMLSITGMTLEQFADLMAGLGYNAEKGERAKVKAVDAAMADPAVPADAATPAADVPVDGAPIMDDALAPVVAEAAETPEVAAAIPEMSETETPVGVAVDSAVAPEIETFYTFTWARPARENSRPTRADGNKPRGKGKPKGDARGKKAPREDKSKSFSARPPKPEKKIDPDNPFAAALMGLKDNK